MTRQNKTRNNISAVTVKNLCVSCSICKEVCPEKAIAMKYIKGQHVPFVDTDLCNNCGLCLSYCYGKNVRLETLENYDRQDAVFGKYLSLYIGHTLNEQIRDISTSGGLITQLAVSSLEKGLVDGVFVVTNTEPQCQAKLTLAVDAQGILEAAGSKYCPVSAENVIAALKSQRDRKFIIVGTPCVVYGIKKYIKNHNLDKDKYYFFGLMCDSTMNSNFVRYIKDKYSDKGEMVIDLKYRTKEKTGWPGGIKVTIGSGREIFLPSSKRTSVKRFFRINRCNYCFDKVNIQSDITFGDCYIKGKSDTKGFSNIIVRTPRGKTLIEMFAEKMFLEKTDRDSIYVSQNLNESKKRLQLGLNYSGIYNLEPGNKIKRMSPVKVFAQIQISQFFSRTGAEYSNYSKFVFLSKAILGVVAITKKMRRMFNRRQR